MMMLKWSSVAGKAPVKRQSILVVRVTGSVAETQKLMTAAFDASRGAGIEYAQAIDIIAKAYVGNYRGIKQLNLGLSESEIKMMSFDELLNKIMTLREKRSA